MSSAYLLMLKTLNYFSSESVKCPSGCTSTKSIRYGYRWIALFMSARTSLALLAISRIYGSETASPQETLPSAWRRGLLHSLSDVVIELWIALWDMASNRLVKLQCILGYMIDGNFHRFEKITNSPLHSTNGRQMPAVRAVQGDCDRVW